MVHCSKAIPVAVCALIPKTEVDMYDFKIDHNEVRRLVREAELMRSQALADLLLGAARGIARFGVAIGSWMRALFHRRRINLSVPAPHR